MGERVDTRRQIIEVIDRLIEGRKPFNALDITKMLRVSSPALNVAAVRSIIGDLWKSKNPIFFGMFRISVAMKRKVMAAIKEMILADRPFTEEDVIRSIGGKDRAGIRRTIRAMWKSKHRAFDGISRTPITVVQTGEMIQCYHSGAQDPTDHPDAVKRRHDGVVDLHVESKGRLNVPAKLIRDIVRARSGEIVSVVANGDVLEISKSNGTPRKGNGVDEHPYTVTAKGNVRLSRDLLALIGSESKTFGCEACSGFLKIREASSI